MTDSPHPAPTADGQQPAGDDAVYLCNNQDCGWIGRGSQTLKEGPATDDWFCPECNETVEPDDYEGVSP